jgi:hypothetical protein
MNNNEIATIISLSKAFDLDTAKNLLNHAILFSPNSIPTENNTFLIFGGIVSEINEETHSLKILNVKSNQESWYSFQEILLEEDLGALTIEEFKAQYNIENV